MDKILKIKLNYFWHLIDFLSFYFNRIGLIYEKIIGKEYEKEINKFNLIDAKNILHIGCGAYPITALVLAKKTSANIVSIDKDPITIKFSKTIINKKKLNEKIKINIGNGEKFPVKNYDTIILSSCASPKFKILEHIFNNADINTKIIVRDIKRNISEINDIVSSNKNIKYIDKIKNHSIPNFSWFSIYLLKKY
jgi:precorrin-6B methylase 2